VFAAGGVSHAAVERLSGRLGAARDEILAGPPPGHREAAGVAGEWITLPDRVLADFRTERPGSDLARWLATARRIREAVDRVLVLGGRDLVTGPRAIVEACCHPHHNELPRHERGGRPRLSFVDGGLDNDATQGLLDLVAPRRDAGTAAARVAEPVDLLETWGMIIVGRGRDEFATAATLRVFLATLLEQLGGDSTRAADLVVAITGDTGRLAGAARGIGCRDAWRLSATGPDPTAVFTAAGVLPCAIVGVDVVRLLEGAATMHRRFREAPVGENPVLQFAGVSHLAGLRAGTTRRLVPWNNRLEAVGHWYDAICAGDTAPRECRPAAPAVVTRLLVGEPRRDRLSLPRVALLAADEDRLDGHADATWPALQAAAIEASRAADAAAGRPVADMLLPRLDEHATGQLLQMLMLATLVERALERP
jgi:glucose-6-phosphate isomerase